MSCFSVGGTLKVNDSASTIHLAYSTKSRLKIDSSGDGELRAGDEEPPTIKLSRL